MAFPDGIGIVDSMMGIPVGDRSEWYAFLRPQLRDRESLDEFSFPAQYMFKEVPEDVPGDPVDAVVAEMDRFGIELAMIAHTHDGPDAEARRRHPDRFVTSVNVDPNEGADGLARIRQGVAEGARSVQWFPAGCAPQVAIADPLAYPLYATCAELGVPLYTCVGVPGPRVPLAPQHVEQLDEVCWTFPDLTLVMRHGAEPWTELAVKLMLKWPNLHYSTSAFAPRYYPQAILDYANTRGRDKVSYAGYFPMGLSLERIMTEMRDVPLRDDVWPAFLRDNSRRLLGLDP